MQFAVGLNCPVSEYCVLLCEHFMAINSTSAQQQKYCQPSPRNQLIFPPSAEHIFYFQLRRQKGYFHCLLLRFESCFSRSTFMCAASIITFFSYYSIQSKPRTFMICVCHKKGHSKEQRCTLWYPFAEYEYEYEYGNHILMFTGQ